MGQKGREYVLKSYGFEQYAELWENTIQDLIDDCGSWSERKIINTGVLKNYD